MEKDLLRANLLAIAVSGLLMLLSGLLLYAFREGVARHVRFFLPVPPIGVAAYIFVFNMFRHYDGRLPHSVWDTLREVALSTGLFALIFCVFVVINVLLTAFLKDL